MVVLSSIAQVLLLCTAVASDNLCLISVLCALVVGQLCEPSLPSISMTRTDGTMICSVCDVVGPASRWLETCGRKEGDMKV